MRLASIPARPEKSVGTGRERVPRQEAPQGGEEQRKRCVKLKIE